MEKYISYLLNKWNVFNYGETDETCRVEKSITSTRTVIEALISEEAFELKDKKLSDDNAKKVTHQILEKFVCYDTLDIDFVQRLDNTAFVNVYNVYKQYNQNEKKKRTSNVELVLDNCIDTCDTWYNSTLYDITTSQLKVMFGDFIQTGRPNLDKHRYEYKIRFLSEGDEYLFSLYDYINKDNTWDTIENITWHIASNTSNKSVLRKFEGKLLTTFK